jgi:tetrapyrrole methylase family protein/MazG family protein/ATP diphosphatase
MASEVTAAIRKGRTEKDVPSLTLAYQLTRKASQVGFDWPDIDGVLKKLDEELDEFREALSLQDKKKAREELGDLLFVMANLGRFLQIDPERALRQTIRKFVSRFRYVETRLRKQGKSPRQSTLLEMDQLWNEAKHKRKSKE